MNIYDWYKIINKAAFLALGLTSKELTMELEGVGEKTIVVFSGNLVSMRMDDDVYILCEFNGQNPFELEGYASYVDANGDIWLGILNEG